MTVSSPEVLEQKLAAVKSIHDIQQVCAAEGLEMTDAQVAQRLIADGAMPRFTNLSLEAQRQVADVLVLTEQDPQIAALMRGGDDGTLTGLLATHGIQLNDEALDALSQPPELDDPQLEQVVGGSATLAIIGAIGGIVVQIATLWIVTHYSTQVRIAETNAKKA